MSHQYYKPANFRLQRSELAVPGSSHNMFEKAFKERVMGHAGAIMSAYRRKCCWKSWIIERVRVKISKNSSVMGETAKSVLK